MRYTSACVLLFLTVASVAEAQTAPPASMPRDARVFIAAGGGVRTETPGFDERFRSTVYAEDAEIDIRYASAGGSALDVGGGVRLWRNIWMGGAFTRTMHRHGAEITASVPHPFRFDDPRSLTARQDGLERAETAVHVQLMYRIRFGRVGLGVFAGPAWISAKQDVVEEVEYDESYPFESVTLRNVTTRNTTSRVTAAGFGASVTASVLRQLSVGVTVRHAAKDVDITPSTGRTLRTKAGGTQVTAGVAVEF